MDPSHRRIELYREHQNQILRRTDHLFAGLLVFEWAAGIVMALVVSPLTWAGTASATHPHVLAAALLGGVIALPAAALAWLRPAQPLTPHAVAVAQAPFT